MVKDLETKFKYPICGSLRIGEKNEKGETEYKKVEQDPEGSYTFEGLKQDTEYSIKVEVKDEEGNVTVIEQTIRTQKMPEINVSNIHIDYSETNWTNQNVTVTLRIDEQVQTKGCKLQYSIDGGKTWTDYKEEVKVEIQENTNIIVKLTDGINDLEVATGRVGNIDKIAPEGKLKIAEVKTGKIGIEIEEKDSISGIAKNIYYLGTKNEVGNHE